MRVRLLLLLVAVLAPVEGWADSGRRVSKASYRSANGDLVLTVDPRWSARETDPLLTLTNRQGEVLWERGSEDFEDFRYPLHACIDDEGKFVVFGGVSVHNMAFREKYRDGLRFYDRDGALTRFVSRRDLPVGQYSVSTAHWYDAARTRIEEGRLVFYTPGREEPMEFSLATGEVLVGELVPGQGDDEQWKERFLKRSRDRAAPD